MLTTFDQKLAEYLNGYQVNGWPVGNLILVMIALVLSMLLCGAVGLEREIRGRSAGLRTHLLVGMGSCVVMIVSIYGFPSQDSVSRDVARLAAQVVSGALKLGDIGKLFPDTDERFKGADSLKLLEEVCVVLGAKGYKIVNIDSIVIAQKPKLAPYIEQMRKNIADACKIDISQVSVKATTEEKLGFTGRLEGISSHAVCLIE